MATAKKYKEIRITPYPFRGRSLRSPIHVPVSQSGGAVGQATRGPGGEEWVSQALGLRSRSRWNQRHRGQRCRVGGANTPATPHRTKRKATCWRPQHLLPRSPSPTLLATPTPRPAPASPPIGDAQHFGFQICKRCHRRSRSRRSPAIRAIRESALLTAELCVVARLLPSLAGSTNGECSNFTFGGPASSTLQSLQSLRRDAR